MEDRLTSAILWRSADEYIKAADILANKKERWGDIPNDLITPVCFLSGVGIELALKAFLRAKGYSEAQLIKVGHDLPKAFSTAKEKGLQELFILKPEYDNVICLLDNGYSTKKGRDFVYATIGMKRLPNPLCAIILAKDLLEKIKKMCYENMKLHDHKDSAVT